MQLLTAILLGAALAASSVAALPDMLTDKTAYVEAKYNDATCTSLKSARINLFEKSTFDTAEFSVSSRCAAGTRKFTIPAPVRYADLATLLRAPEIVVTNPFFADDCVSENKSPYDLRLDVLPAYTCMAKADYAQKAPSMMYACSEDGRLTVTEFTDKACGNVNTTEEAASCDTFPKVGKFQCYSMEMDPALAKTPLLAEPEALEEFQMTIAYKDAECQVPFDSIIQRRYTDTVTQCTPLDAAKCETTSSRGLAEHVKQFCLQAPLDYTQIAQLLSASDGMFVEELYTSQKGCKLPEELDTIHASSPTLCTRSTSALAFRSTCNESGVTTRVYIDDDEEADKRCVNEVEVVPNVIPSYEHIPRKSQCASWAQYRCFGAGAAEIPLEGVNNAHEVPGVINWQGFAVAIVAVAVYLALFGKKFTEKLPDFDEIKKGKKAEADKEKSTDAKKKE